MTTAGLDDLVTRIYSLHEPAGEIRYVGKTILSLRERLSTHISNARRGTRSYCGSWIRSLLAKEQMPEIRLIETVLGESWIEAERRWIAYYRGHNARLVNLTDGGEGHPGYSPSAEQRMQMSIRMRGFRHSDETRRKLSEMAKERPPRTGWNHSEETVELIRKRAQERDPLILRQSGLIRRIVNPLREEPDPRSFSRPPAWRNAIGEANRGSRNGSAKLIEEQVEEIKRLLLTSSLSQSEIASQYRVSRELIGLIQRNKRWAHVPWPQP